MERIKPNSTELERALLVAREQTKLRLALSGYTDEDDIPSEVEEQCLLTSLSHLDLEAIMPEHFAEVNVIKNQMLLHQDKAADESLGMGERLAAQVEIEKAIKADPWKRNILHDFNSALKDEMLEVRKEFKARVRLGKKKVSQ